MYLYVHLVEWHFIAEDFLANRGRPRGVYVVGFAITKDHTRSGVRPASDLVFGGFGGMIRIRDARVLLPIASPSVHVASFFSYSETIPA